MVLQGTAFPWIPLRCGLGWWALLDRDDWLLLLTAISDGGRNHGSSTTIALAMPRASRSRTEHALRERHPSRYPNMNELGISAVVGGTI
jgi:hypothetical protein